MRYFVIILALSCLARAEDVCSEADKLTMKHLAIVADFSSLTEDQLDAIYHKGEICFVQIAKASHKKTEMKMSKKDLTDLLNIEIVSDHAASEKYARVKKCPNPADPVVFASATI